MLRLIRVELRRLLSRRLVRIFAALMVAGLLVLNGVQFFKSSKDAGSGVSDARVRAEQLAAQLQAEYEQHPERFGERPLPADELVGQFIDDPRYIMREKASDYMKGAGAVAVNVLFVIGASFVGAEWMAGTMQALLFWEPRRARVMLAKAAALAIVAVLATLLFQFFQVGLSAVTAQLRGVLDTDAAFWSSLLKTALRVSGLAVFASLLAFAIGGLTRHTAAALGVAFAYFVIIENAITLWKPWLGRYLLSPQFDAILNGRKYLPANSDSAFSNSADFLLTAGRAMLTLSVYLALALGAMTSLFVRRDVT